MILKTLSPYIKFYKHYFWVMMLGLGMVIMTLMASIFLLSLSGWFLASTAVVGVAGLYTFNYMLPAAGVRGAAIARTAIRYFERLINHNTTFKILSVLRVRAFNKVVSLSVLECQEFKKADLLNRFIADIDNLDHLYLRLFSPIISALVIVSMLFFGLSAINLQAALVISIVLSATILVVPIIFYQLSKTLGERLAYQKNDYRQQLVSYLQGQAELTLFNARQVHRAKLDIIEKNWMNDQKCQSTLLAISTSLITLIAGLLTLLILWLIASITTTPIVALFVFVCLASVEILAPIPTAFIFLGQVMSSAKRMTAIFEKDTQLHFPEEDVKIEQSLASVKMTNICFSYPNQPLNVLTHFSLNIEKGEHVAILGQTGCGKSTVINLITRAFDPINGKIEINGCDIRTLTELTLRKMIAVVPQTITIFSDTLRNNLKIGNIEASDEQIIRILHQVELDKLLVTDDGLDLWLGDNGRPLSGGEKRRIGIARALLHDSPLILMDEPTESLDKETELSMIYLIKRTCQHKTLIMVTHRLTESSLFDRMISLD